MVRRVGLVVRRVDTVDTGDQHMAEIHKAVGALVASATCKVAMQTVVVERGSLMDSEPTVAGSMNTQAFGLAPKFDCLVDFDYCS